MKIAAIILSVAASAASAAIPLATTLHAAPLATTLHHAPAIAAPISTTFHGAAPLARLATSYAPAYGLARTYHHAPAIATVAAPVATTTTVAHPPQPFAFRYAVNDAATGSHFIRSEENDGQTTTGAYSVALPDGRVQHVNYVADDAGGFNAQVTYEGQAQFPATPVAVAHAPVAYAAPAIAAVAPIARTTTLHHAPALVRQTLHAPAAITHHVAPVPTSYSSQAILHQPAIAVAKTHHVATPVAAIAPVAAVSRSITSVAHPPLVSGFAAPAFHY